MVDINIGNFITIGLISIAFYAGTKWVLKSTGYAPSWL